MICELIKHHTLCTQTEDSLFPFLPGIVQIIIWVLQTDIITGYLLQ